MQRKTLFIRLDEENKPLKEAKKEQSRSQEESQMWVRQVLGGGGMRLHAAKPEGGQVKRSTSPGLSTYSTCQ